MEEFSDEDQAKEATPPFIFTNDEELKLRVLKSNLNRIPIHTAYNGKPFDKML